MPEIPHPAPDQLIHDPALARDMAHAEKPYRELELHAKELKLDPIATNMALQADVASEAVRAQAQSASGENTPDVGSEALPSGLKVKYETFGEAKKHKKLFSDSFIDGAINGALRYAYSLKTYLDEVEATAKDTEVIDDPERIAGLYLRTTEMLARNLKITIVRSNSPEQAQTRREEIKRAIKNFLKQLGEEAPRTASEIVDWCRDYTTYKFPMRAMEYRGFKIDGTDILDAQGKGTPDVRPNFKIQRQIGGEFVMAYTDKRVHEKMTGQAEVLDKRIYLNPDMEATPQLFEQLLQAANEAGIPMQLKMFQRAPEVAAAHASKHKAGGLRGDGIVVYVEGKHADYVLGMVLALAKDNPDAFKGRMTSRIPQNVAEGIAVGDEPVQMPDTSLTSHRVIIINYVAEIVRKSGKQGEEARVMFRDLVKRSAELNGVSPDNIAFNT